MLPVGPLVSQEYIVSLTLEVVGCVNARATLGSQTDRGRRASGCELGLFRQQVDSFVHTALF